MDDVVVATGEPPSSASQNRAAKRVPVVSIPGSDHCLPLHTGVRRASGGSLKANSGTCAIRTEMYSALEPLKRKHHWAPISSPEHEH